MAGEPTFAPPVAPQFPLEDAHEPRILKAQFGDGYAQRTPDGLNHDLERNTWTWENLDYAEYTAIWTFITGQKGYLPFLYAVPWGGAPVMKKYVATKYSRSRPSASSWGIVVEVEEVIQA